MASLIFTLRGTSDTVRGVVDVRFGQPVWHFRGIRYGHIARRFAEPEYVELGSQEIDATKFGPQCPQPDVDPGHLLRVPPNIKFTRIEEDELECLNLNITTPPHVGRNALGLLPVLVWVHDPTQMVSQATSVGKPMIVVTFNYRLNIFAFNCGEGAKNLALQDQRLALEWVSKNIVKFGGDPDQITLAGESAGAVYVHAHILHMSGCLAKRAILASGSLHLSPPQNVDVSEKFISRLRSELATRGHTLHDGPSSSLVQSLTNCGVVSMWLQQEPGLDHWQDRVEQVETLMVSDVEYESVIWRNGVEAMDVDEIILIILGDKKYSELAKLYNIYPGRPSSCKHGVLDFINDARFALPAFEISERWRRGHGEIFQYIIDEPNPWQASSRAHHAVDLLFLFGGVDLSFNHDATEVATELREAWIDFAHGGKPWPRSNIRAFGPHSRCENLDLEAYARRRRVKCFDFLQKLGAPEYMALSGKLGAGRLSLLN
ncbi:Alpha/Beta hydrolase protein [Hypoxylon fuscum]|nr:Alpha/Beta hydrolase protein [Hypoxylon fuscum]